MTELHLPAYRRSRQRRARRQPRRLGVQPAAQGADHLPRHRGHRLGGQPDLRPAAAARGRGPRARHQPVHQLARWLGLPRAWRSTTRCSSSRTTSPRWRMGMAASMGQLLLCAGTKGKRYALPHARIMMHQPSGGIGGTAADIAIQAEQMLYTKRMFQERMSFHTGQSAGADRGGLRPRPLVHRRGGEGLRVHRPGDHRCARRSPRAPVPRN